MRRGEVVQWIRDECERRGDNFACNYTVDGVVEVLVNDMLVLRSAEEELDPQHVKAAYEAASLPAGDRNPNQNWGLPDIDGRFALGEGWGRVQLRDEPILTWGNDDIVLVESEILKDKEGEVAGGWIQNWSTATTTQPMSGYGHTVQVVPCKSKLHYIVVGSEFCAGCCWNCQKGEAPFCASCRKTMRAEEKEGESVRSFALEHFPSLVPFLD